MLRNMTMGDDFAARRTASGLSQAGLAAKAGVSAAVVSQFERGHVPSDAMRRRLALVLKCDPDFAIKLRARVKA